jgi:hypothetical protein
MMIPDFFDHFDYFNLTSIQARMWGHNRGGYYVVNKLPCATQRTIGPLPSVEAAFKVCSEIWKAHLDGVDYDYKTKENPMNLSELVSKNRGVYTLYSNQFNRVFGVQLKEFWHNIMGFDLLAFDDWLNAGDRSIKDAVEEQFGDEGVTLIAKIIESEIEATDDTKTA